MRMNQEQKQINKNNLLRIGAAAIRHAVKSAPLDNETSKLIERHIVTALSGNGSEIQKVMKQEPVRASDDIPKTRLRYATEELIRLADFHGYVSGNQVRHILLACWDALYSDNKLHGLADGEQAWQDKNLEPLIEKCFQNPGVPLTPGEEYEQAA